MNENEVKKIVQQELLQGQYQVPPTPYHAHTGLDSPKILFSSLDKAPNTFLVAKTTNGTTAVNVFTSKGAPYNLVITGAFLISNDTTAGNITLANNGSSVCVIAKGTASAALVGATSLSFGTYVAGNPLTVASSSAGNATVFISYVV